MTNLCAVTADLNRYLDSFDKEDQYLSFINKRVEELTQPDAEFYPFTEQNFCEALSESDLRETACLFQQGLTLLAGIKTQLVVTEYWKRLAKSKAETEAETECRECFGDGCPACLE